MIDAWGSPWGFLVRDKCDLESRQVLSSALEVQVQNIE